MNIYYDALNRIDYKTYTSDGRTVDYTYDEVRSSYYNIGALTTVTSPEAMTEYNYDNMGRQVNETRTIDSVAYTTDRFYDLAGRLGYIIYPDGNQYDYSYHPMGYLKDVKQGTDTLAYFTGHNALGQIGYETRNNAAVATTYTYWVDNYRLDSMVTSTGTGVIQNLAYDFDDVGNVETITDGLNSVDHLFVYDEVNRLTDAVATCPSDPSRQYDQIYTYDLAGNMTAKTGIGGWTVNQFDTRKRPTEVVFDQNVAGVGQRQMTYNQDNKPTYIEYNGVGTDLYYDGGGNRVKKVSGSETVIYVGGIYEERDGQATSHIFANGKRIATLTGGHKYFQHTDHLGSTSLVTDENGILIEEIGYLPFGAELFRNEYNNGTWVSSYKFTGQELDNSTKLYNYDARLYDPVLGRFISPDILISSPYCPQNLNRYSYCLNNPLVFIDPSGLSIEIWGDGTAYYFDDGIDEVYYVPDEESEELLTVVDTDGNPITMKTFIDFVATVYAESAPKGGSSNFTGDIFAIADVIVNRGRTGNMTTQDVLDRGSEFKARINKAYKEVKKHLGKGGDEDVPPWAKNKVQTVRLGVVDALNPNGEDQSNGAHFFEALKFLDATNREYRISMFTEGGWGDTEGTVSGETNYCVTVQRGDSGDHTVFMNYNPYFRRQLWP